MRNPQFMRNFVPRFLRSLAALAARPLRVGRYGAGLALLFVAAQAHAALQVDASVNPHTIRPGEMLDLELVVSNTDAVQRTSVVLTLTFPVGLNSILYANFGATCPPSYCDPGETVTWNIGTVAAGHSVTVDMPAFVAAATANGTVISFNPHVTDSTGDSDDDSVSTTVVTNSHYDIALRPSADPVAAGAQLTYKLSFGYREEALALANSTLSFPVPAGTSFVSATGGGVFNAGTVTWNLGTMSPGDGNTREVTVHVTAADNSVLHASAQIFNAAVPSDQASATTLAVVETSPLITVDVDAEPDPAAPGEQITVRYIVTNHDSVTRLNLSLRARFSDELSSTYNGSINGGSCPPSYCDPGEQQVWTIASIGAGQSLTFELPAVVAAAAPDGTLINFFAMLSDPVGGNATGIDSVRVRTLPRYEVAVRPSADPVAPGAQLTYKLSFGYREEAPSLADSTMSFRLPPGTSFVSATDGGTLSGGAVNWSLGLLSPGDGGTREVIVQVNAADSSILQASAQAYDDADPIQQALAEALTVVHSSSPIAVQIDANPDPARPGEMMNVRAVVTNRDSIARTLTLRMRYPDGVNATYNGNLGWNTAASCPPSYCDPTEIVTWSFGSVPAGQSITVELPPIVATAAQDGQLISFFALLSDTVGGNASGVDSVRVLSRSRYDLALRQSADPIAPGAQLTYKLSYGYRQDAPTVATSSLRVRLAPGTSFVSATGGGTLSGSDVTWSLGTLNPGDGGFRELTVQVNAGDASVLQTAAEVYDNASPLEAEGAESLTTVDTSAPIGLQIAVNADPARPGEILNAQFIVTNHDVITRTLTLRARYPDGLNSTYNGNLGWNTAGSCPPSYCDPQEMVTWSVGSLAPGKTVTVELPPVVAAAAVNGQMINFFGIVTDTAGGIAVGSDTVRVSSDTRYDLMVRDSADAVQPGAQLTYKLTFGYRADAPVIADSALRFRLPAGTSFVSATQSGTLVGDTVQWSLGQLSPGDGGIRAVTVNVNANGGDVLQGQAEVYSTSSPVEQSGSEVLTTVDINPALSLDVRALSNPSQPNQAMTVQLTVTNLDVIDRNVTLRVRYPDGVNSISPSAFMPAGSCPPSFCDPQEMVTWNLGFIPASGSVVITMPPVAATADVYGQLINFFGIATDTQGGIATGIDSVRLGLCADDDSDCDSVPDSVDNCILADNSTQRDTDGDGIGNACDADLDQNCIVNFSDLGIFKQVFFTADPNADFDGNGQVNFVDLGVLKLEFFHAPGPSGVPNLCNP
jgi:trimeric autotransporter adhesin